MVSSRTIYKYIISVLPGISGKISAKQKRIQGKGIETIQKNPRYFYDNSACAWMHAVNKPEETIKYKMDQISTVATFIPLHIALHFTSALERIPVLSLLGEYSIGSYMCCLLQNTLFHILLSAGLCSPHFFTNLNSAGKVVKFLAGLGEKLEFDVKVV